ncbi:hypothetical protein RF11_09172 [Thelohanellus kitauei]|uniref:Uncharacterized protein n=1 Tax=Thelohanellus kitauei TaxID=669202 RepID=A0A0C2JP90_THEKT|nr:hypothetical protein RF11_09172 [Thelohanellus kitauei]
MNMSIFILFLSQEYLFDIIFERKLNELLFSCLSSHCNKHYILSHQTLLILLIGYSDYGIKLLYSHEFSNFSNRSTSETSTSFYRRCASNRPLNIKYLIIGFVM